MVSSFLEEEQTINWGNRIQLCPSEEELVGIGKYLVGNHDFYTNSSNADYLYENKDYPKTFGCCGSPESETLNLSCKCSHPIAREVSDCIYPKYIRYKSEEVVLKKDILNIYAIFHHPSVVKEEILDMMQYASENELENYLNRFREK